MYKRNLIRPQECNFISLYDVLVPATFIVVDFFFCKNTTQALQMKIFIAKVNTIDHRRAYTIAKAIKELNSKIITVNLDEVQTNMLFVKISSDKITSRDFVQRLKTTNSNHDDDKILVRGMALTQHSARFVLYYEIDDEMVSAAIRKFTYIIKELEN